MLELTFITGNAAKAEQLAYHLEVAVGHQKIDLPEIQSLDLKEIIAHKAKGAYDIIGKPVLVEDTSLTFHALGRLPGPLIKWFLTELNNAGLARLLDGYRDRSATADVRFGLYDGDELKVFSATKKGRIADSPRGKHGFGWDPIFIPEGYDRTWGEMSLEEQKDSSMRRVALKKLEVELRQSGRA